MNADLDGVTLRKHHPKAPPRNLFANMNKTEEAFAHILEAQKRSGEIREWHFEGLTLRLGDDCRYTPDFYTVEAAGFIHLHETKGFMRDDALVKLKTCATIYPFPLTLWLYSKGQWTRKPISPL